MPEALRPFLLGIVLVNLAFVQLTGAVSLHWMTGLWLLTALAPAVVRWNERLWYRGVWNGAVMASFAFLVHDAMTSGLLHMLEDGLLLAALCQVHLLNNIGRHQRPDLLFFNSFLIAFVTSFFCGDGVWSLCFLLYAAQLVPALQLYVVLPRTASPPPGLVRAVLGSGARHGVVVLVVTGIVFAAWPRDFEREGWLGDTLAFGGRSLVAFAEEVRIDRSSVPAQSEVEVLRIRPRDGLAATCPPHWRGATFVYFDGAGWQPYRARDFGTRGATDPQWRGAGPTSWERPGEARGAALDVQLLRREHGRLFLPLDAIDIDLRGRTGFVLLDPKADGGVAVAAGAGGAEGPALAFAVQRGRAVGDPGILSPRARAVLLHLPGRLPQPLLELATTVRGELPADAGPAEIAEHARVWLSTHRRYALPGTTGAARSLDDFVLGTGGGHCEYFATTLALVLRLLDVPCRVAGGYLAHEWNDARGEVVVRERDAHAWVEAYVPGLGWSTVDATPAAATTAVAERSWWQQGLDLVQAAWNRVAGFDAADRRALGAWLLALPSRLLAALAHPAGAAALALLLAGCWWWRRRRRGPTAVLVLRTAMRRAGLVHRAGETPRELLTRARRERAGAADAGLEQLAAAVAAHEEQRYS